MQSSTSLFYPLTGVKAGRCWRFPFLEAENLIDIDYMDKEPLVESCACVCVCISGVG